MLFIRAGHVIITQFTVAVVIQYNIIIDAAVYTAVQI